jgi:hypothetical protein
VRLERQDAMFTLLRFLYRHQGLNSAAVSGKPSYCFAASSLPDTYIFAYRLPFWQWHDQKSGKKTPAV